MACAGSEPPPGRAPGADLLLRSVVLEQYARDGTPLVRTRLAEAAYQRDAKRIDGRTVAVERLDREGGTVATVRSGAAQTDLGSGIAYLRDDVEMRTRDGDRLRTAALRADLVARRATGTDRVRLEGSGYEIAAPAFSARWDDRPELRFERGVRASLPAAGPAPEKKTRPSKRRRGGPR